MRTREYAFYMVWDADEAVWETNVPDLNGLSTYGETQEVAIAMTREAIELYVEVARERGETIPEPASAVGTIAVAVA